MRYYIVSDIHGYFSEFHHVLTQAGFDGCTAYSGMVNVVVIEDDEIEE